MDVKRLRVDEFRFLMLNSKRVTERMVRFVQRKVTTLSFCCLKNMGMVQRSKSPDDQRLHRFSAMSRRT